MELTYDYQHADDDRQNIGHNVCTKDPLFGCSPFERGTFGQPAHVNGSTAGFFNFAAALAKLGDIYVGIIEGLLESSSEFELHPLSGKYIKRK